MPPPKRPPIPHRHPPRPALPNKPGSRVETKPPTAPRVPTVRGPQPPSSLLAKTPRKPNCQTVQPKPKNQAPLKMPQSAVVQRLKIYPNLHPGAVEPVDQNNVFRLNSFAGQYRLQRRHSHGVNVPNMQYNFVRTREGETLLHSRYRHPSIAEGKQVLYAGEIFFNNGKLSWWSNGSGHYQPFAEDAEQANLPMDQFYSYQQIIKGEHTRQKGNGGGRNGRK